MNLDEGRSWFEYNLFSSPRAALLVLPTMTDQEFFAYRNPEAQKLSRLQWAPDHVLQFSSSRVGSIYACRL